MGLHPDSGSKDLHILKWAVVCSQCCQCSKQSTFCLRKAFSLVNKQESIFLVSCQKSYDSKHMQLS